MRVIFDRSAFHGESFNVLKRSPLREAVSRNRIQVFHTPAFIEETISTFGSTRPSAEWQAHLTLAVDLCNGGVFLTKDEIWRDELVRRKGVSAQRLFPERPRNGRPCRSQILDRLRSAAVSGDLSKAWETSQSERQETQEKKSKQQALYATARRQAAESLKAIRASPRRPSFADFRAAEFVATGKALMKTVDSHRAESLGKQWAARPDRFPYYSAFVEGFVYSIYYAEFEHNLPIDRNAQMDYEQLAYLTWGDVIVSNDTRFLRSAFEAIWKPRGKGLESGEGFAALVAKF